MADWFRDVDTGELIPADSLSSDSYTPVGDWQPLDAQQPEPRQFEFPSWLTTSGGLGSVPARALGSLAQGGAGLEQLLGEGLAGLGFENNPILEDAMLNRRMARDLVSQSVEDNNVQPGSWQDIAGTVGGEALAMAPTLGGGLLLNAGKRALTTAPSMLNRLYMAAAPAALPSGTRYGQLRDEGISPGEAALGAGESFALNTALNTFDVASLLKPRTFAQRIVPMTVTGGLTNAGGAIGDAYIDKQVGAPQTQDEFFRNLGISTLAGAATGAGMSMLPTGLRSVPGDESVSGPSIADLESRIMNDLAEAPAPQPDVAPSALADLSVPPPFEGPNTFIPDSMVRTVQAKARPEIDPLAKITPPEEPLIKIEEVSTPRSEQDILYAQEIRDVLAPWSAANARQRNLEDVFLPKGTELEAFRDSLPEGTLSPPAFQRDKIVKVVTDSGTISKRLSPEEQSIAAAVLEEDPIRLAREKAKEDVARIEETRADRKSSPTSDSDLILKAPTEAKSFPDSIIVDSQQNPGATDASIVIDEGFRARTPEAQQQATETLRGAAWDTFKNKNESPKPDAVAGEQLSLFADTQPSALDAADSSPVEHRRAFGKRIATSRKYKVKASEAGFIDFGWVRDWLQGKPDVSKDPNYTPLSPSNKRYGGVWAQQFEWMDTTRRVAPQSQNFIDAHWKIPQDLNAIVYDAKQTLDPYLALPDAEQKAVNNYLVVARRVGSTNPEYKVTPETAARAGLNPKQAEAALAVNKWSNGMLKLLEDHAIEGAKHKAFMESQNAVADSRKKAIITIMNNEIADIQARFSELRNGNYVPFSRYGEFYINAFDKDGNLSERQHFDSNNSKEFRDTFAHFKRLAKEQGLPEPKAGQKAPPKLNRYDGVPKDVLEILNDPYSEVQGFYKHFKPAALVPGFNPNLLRNISEYTTGAAKLISMQRAERVAAKELVTSLSSPDDINLSRKLTAWAESLDKPTSDTFKLLNNAFNIAYIGGNARTPTADILGRIQLQYPLLSKYLKGAQPEAVFAKGVGKEMQWWFSDSEKFAKLHPDLSAGIVEAQRKGIIPTNVYKTFLRNSRGQNKGTRSALNTVHDIYFGLKEITERSADLGGFILGWDAYPLYVKGKGAGTALPSRQQFAESFVRESRAVPTQSELPPNALFKSETGRLVTKYRMYQAKIAKSMMEAGLGQWARYLGSVGFTTGLMGLPFVKDAISAGRAGGLEPEDELRKAGAGPATLYGPASKLAGIDFSASAGFGEIFPGSGSNVLSKFALGMAGAPAEQGIRAKNYLERGQNLKALAAMPFMPNLLANSLNALDWTQRGVVTLGGKAVVPRDQVTATDVLKKMAGFQPLNVKEAMVKENRKKQVQYDADTNQFINQKIGEALGLGNTAEAKALRQYARENKIKTNDTSIRRYRDMIQGKDVIPKKKRRAIQEIDNLFD